MCTYERENAEDSVLIAAGSVFPLCNESFCQRPGVDLCHQEWYLSLVQKRGRHVEHNKEQGERLLYCTVQEERVRHAENHCSSQMKQKRVSKRGTEGCISGEQGWKVLLLYQRREKRKDKGRGDYALEDLMDCGRNMTR